MKNTVSLQGLFNDRIFRVPDYQRGYAWEKQQVQEFLDDLSLLSSSRRHYTGTIILHPPQPEKEYMDSEGNSYVGNHVVDGQQRLTTIVLLLNEISSALGSYEAKRGMAEGVKKKFVEAKNDAGQTLRKLRLNQEDTDNFFQNGVLPESPAVIGPPNASARRLLDAKNQIASFLRDGEDDVTDRQKWLVDLHKKVTNGLHFNLYEIEDAAEVGVIFEVTNDRGKPLTNLEKVKNYLLYTASSLGLDTSEFVKSVNSAWAEILTKLMSADLGARDHEDRLLRAHWLMVHEPKSRHWHGSKSIKNEFGLRQYKDKGKSKQQLLTDLANYVAGLRDACPCYCDIYKPDRSDAFKAVEEPALRREIVLWSSRLVRTGSVATFLPLLMAVRKHSTAAPRHYREIVELCERFAFRIYHIARRRSNYRQYDQQFSF